jgi:hypothetical protein
MTSAERIEPECGRGRRAIRWMLVSRTSGRLTIAQWPNISLWVFIILTIGLHILHPKGGAGKVIGVLADAALLVWAADELIRGVNPFRRILGSLVIAVTIYSLAR